MSNHNCKMTFAAFRRLAETAGVEAFTFHAAPQQLIILRGNGIVVSHAYKDDDDFEDALGRALKEFSRTRLGWKLRNPNEQGEA